MKLRNYIDEVPPRKRHRRRLALADFIGVSEVAVRHYANGTRQIPAKQVLPLVRATHGRVTPHDLRPDLYPDPDWLPADVREDEGQKAA